MSWEEVIAGPEVIDGALEAREALRVLAELPARQRDDLTLFVAGFSYREIAQITGGRTYTNVNKHLAKARARIRLAKFRAAAGPKPGADPPMRSGEFLLAYGQTSRKLLPHCYLEAAPKQRNPRRSAASWQSGRPDLNRGPRRPERRALPGCATPRSRSYSSRSRPGSTARPGP